MVTITLWFMIENQETLADRFQIFVYEIIWFYNLVSNIAVMSSHLS